MRKEIRWENLNKGRSLKETFGKGITEIKRNCKRKKEDEGGARKKREKGGVERGGQREREIIKLKYEEKLKVKRRVGIKKAKTNGGHYFL